MQMGIKKWNFVDKHKQFTAAHEKQLEEEIWGLSGRQPIVSNHLFAVQSSSSLPLLAIERVLGRVLCDGQVSHPFILHN
jgi:hypothetical protein